MIPVLTALEEILARARLLETEQIFLSDAGGRVLAGPLCSPSDLPRFDRSAVDGYAIAQDDPAELFEVLGEIRAGEPSLYQIKKGQAVRIFTGAMLPQGAGQVVMQEDILIERDKIRIIRSSGASHIRQRGEDAREGEVLIPSGRRLGPAEMALLAGVGEVRPKVRMMPRVVHLVSGDELVDPGEEPVGAEIRDSNSILMSEMIKVGGARLILQERVPDGLNPFLEVLQKVGQDAYDILLVSGGASVGAYDFGRALLLKLEFEIHFEQVNLRPGKPFIFGSRGRQLAFVLPGNPVSHWVVFGLFIRPLLGAMMGLSLTDETHIASLEEDFFYQPNPRPTFWPARARLQSDHLMVTALPWQSSGDLTGIVGSNAWICLPSMASSHRKGDKVEVRLLGHL